LQIECGLAKRLIFGEDDLLGGIAVVGFQALATAGFGIHAIELVAIAATDEAETIFHKHDEQPIKEVNRVATG